MKPDSTQSITGLIAALRVNIHDTTILQIHMPDDAESIRRLEANQRRMLNDVFKAITGRDATAEEIRAMRNGEA